MHPPKNHLRAMIDQELAQDKAEEIRKHVSGCPTCQARLAVLQSRAEQVHKRLDTLSPEKQGHLANPQAVFLRVIEQARQKNAKKELFTTMFTRKSLWTALAVILILGLVFTMTPARAWASDFLGLFRVQKIAVVEFDPLAAERGHEAFPAQEELVRQLIDENMTVTGGERPYEAASLEEAAAATGFRPHWPEALLNGKIMIQPSQQAALEIDQPEMQALLDAFDIDATLSPDLDGQVVTVDAPTGVVISDDCQPNPESAGRFGGCMVFYQMPSPTVNAPEGLNVDVLGEAVLQLLGYSPAQARAFSRTIDWTSTLLVPIPSGEGIQHEEVSLNGVTATLFTHAEEPGSMLMWVKDGMLYALRGPGGPGQVLEIGNTVP